MMKRTGILWALFLALPLLLGMEAGAATVNFAITNSDTTPYNGPLTIYPIRARWDRSPILADGTFFIGGVPQRITVTNSLGSAQCMRGPYFASNSVVQFCFAVPIDFGIFNAASNLISGYNIFAYNPGITADEATNISWAITTQYVTTAISGMVTNAGAAYSLQLEGATAYAPFLITNNPPLTKPTLAFQNNADLATLTYQGSQVFSLGGGSAQLEFDAGLATDVNPAALNPSLGAVPLAALPSVVVTNGESNVTLAGSFTGTINGGTGGNPNAVTNKVYLNVRDYGAVIDGLSIYTNLNITPGSATVIASNWNFAASDAGKNVELIPYMNSSNHIPSANGLSNFSTTISAVVNKTNITLAGTVPASFTNFTAFQLDYGHDDTPAVQACINYIASNAVAGVIFVPNGYGRSLFLDGPWITCVPSSPGPTYYFNTILTLPYLTNLYGHQWNIELRGENPDNPDNFDQPFGSRIKCSRSPTAFSPYGYSGKAVGVNMDASGNPVNWASDFTIIGAPRGYNSPAGVNLGGCNAIALSVSHLNIDTYFCCPYCPFNTLGLDNFCVISCNIGTDTPGFGNGTWNNGQQATYKTFNSQYCSAAMIMPDTDNNIQENVENVSVHGYDIGFVFMENVHANNLYGQAQIGILELSSLLPTTIERVDIYGEQYLLFFGYNTVGNVDYGQARVTATGLYNEAGYTIWDPANIGSGVVAGSLSGSSSYLANVVGGNGIEVIDTGMSATHNRIRIGTGTSSNILASSISGGGLTTTLPNGSSVTFDSTISNSVTMAGSAGFAGLNYSASSPNLVNSWLINESGNLHTDSVSHLVLSCYGVATTNASLIVPGTKSFAFSGGTSGNGIQDYVAVTYGTPYAFGTNDWTISLFFMPSNLLSYMWVWSDCAIGGNLSATNVLSIRMRPGGVFDVPTGGAVPLTSTLAAKAGVYNSVILSRSGGNFSFWINGMQDSATWAAPTFNDAGTNFVLGAEPDAPDWNKVNGQIDKPQVWSRGLSALEIAALQIQGAPLLYLGNGSRLTAINGLNITATNIPSAGNALRYNGANFYWGP